MQKEWFRRSLDRQTIIKLNGDQNPNASKRSSFERDVGLTSRARMYREMVCTKRGNSQKRENLFPCQETSSRRIRPAGKILGLIWLTELL